jgi:hypothetical protein
MPSGTLSIMHEGLNLPLFVVLSDLHLFSFGKSTYCSLRCQQGTFEYREIEAQAAQAVIERSGVGCTLILGRPQVRPDIAGVERKTSPIADLL